MAAAAAVATAARPCSSHSTTSSLSRVSLPCAVRARRRQGTPPLLLPHPAGHIRPSSTCKLRVVALQTTAQDSNNDTNGDSKDSWGPPAGCSRFSVTLKRPLGLILEEDKAGNIFVGEVQKGGNAEAEGSVTVGDQLIATSAVVYTKAQRYGEVNVRGGEQVVRLNVRGEDFKTVMAAIGTHPGHMEVKLEFQKCEPGRGPLANSR
eukprot:jgi/Chlat1/3319/Chrsp22S03414